MDWLDKSSPMWVDWRRKKMQFTYENSRIKLSGIKDCTSTWLPLKVTKLKGLMKKAGIA